MSNNRNGLNEHMDVFHFSTTSAQRANVYFWETKKKQKEHFWGGEIDENLSIAFRFIEWWWWWSFLYLSLSMSYSNSTVRFYWLLETPFDFNIELMLHITILHFKSFNFSNGKHMWPFSIEYGFVVYWIRYALILYELRTPVPPIEKFKNHRSIKTSQVRNSYLTLLEKHFWIQNFFVSFHFNLKIDHPIGSKCLPFEGVSSIQLVSFILILLFLFVVAFSFDVQFSIR